MNSDAGDLSVVVEEMLNKEFKLNVLYVFPSLRLLSSLFFLIVSRGLGFTDDEEEDPDEDAESQPASQRLQRQSSSLLNNRTSIQQQNEKLLKDLTSQVEGLFQRILFLSSRSNAFSPISFKGTCMPVLEGIDALSIMRTRKIRPVTTYRGFLEIAPQLRIPVWSYLKSAEAKFPSSRRGGVRCVAFPHLFFSLLSLISQQTGARAR